LMRRILKLLLMMRHAAVTRGRVVPHAVLQCCSAVS
jgi:hypothetical protein